MIDPEPKLPTGVLEDDISDAELEAIAEGMLKDVMARKADAQRKLDEALVQAMDAAGEYFRTPPSQ